LYGFTSYVRSKISKNALRPFSTQVGKDNILENSI
jgi:hypothetical protein